MQYRRIKRLANGGPDERPLSLADAWRMGLGYSQGKACRATRELFHTTPPDWEKSLLA